MKFGTESGGTSLIENLRRKSAQTGETANMMFESETLDAVQTHMGRSLTQVDVEVQCSGVGSEDAYK
eukprot:4700206-Karenia_brevis.AAC.1